jgi:hypothetical protein
MFHVAFKYGIADPREIEAVGNLVGDEQVAKGFDRHKGRGFCLQDREAGQTRIQSHLPAEHQPG